MFAFIVKFSVQCSVGAWFLISWKSGGGCKVGWRNPLSP